MILNYKDDNISLIFIFHINDFLTDINEPQQ